MSLEDPRAALRTVRGLAVCGLAFVLFTLASEVPLIRRPLILQVTLVYGPLGFDPHLDQSTDDRAQEGACGRDDRKRQRAGLTVRIAAGGGNQRDQRRWDQQ